MSLPSNTNSDSTGESRSVVVDMLPAAIDQRLHEYFQLWNFLTKLRRFQRVEPNPSAPASTSPSSPHDLTADSITE